MEIKRKLVFLIIIIIYDRVILFLRRIPNTGGVDEIELLVHHKQSGGILEHIESLEVSGKQSVIGLLVLGNFDQVQRLRIGLIFGINVQVTIIGALKRRKVTVFPLPGE